MQTAAQVEQYPVYPAQSGKKKSNGLVKASFIIGLILLVLGVLNTGFFNIFLQSLIHKGTLPAGQYGIIAGVISIVVFGIPGILGLILGIIGFRKMIKEPPPYDYLTAVAGIGLCLMYSIGLFMNLIAVFANLIFGPLLYR